MNTAVRGVHSRIPLVELGLLAPGFVRFGRRQRLLWPKPCKPWLPARCLKSAKVPHPLGKEHSKHMCA